jgi:hypothetical protein
MNGHVERIREEWWERYEGETELLTMQGARRDGEAMYNAIRPHQAMAMRTPVAFLAEQFGIHIHV